LNRPGQLGPILRGQFLFRFVRGDLHQAEHHAEEMRHLGETHNDVRWKHAGSVVSGVVCTVLGKFVDARGHAENALSLWDPTFRAFAASPEDPYVMTRLYLFRMLLCLGYVDQARLRRDEVLAEARRLSPYNLAYALSLAWIGGDWAIEGVKSARTMLRAADEVLAISREQGFPLWFAFGNIIRGWCLGTLKQFAEGIPVSLQGLVDARATGCKLVMPFFLTRLAELYGMAGQPKEGLARLAEAAELLETTQERWAEAEMHRLRGTLLLSTNDRVAAKESYCRAIAVAQQQSAKFWELRSACGLARLWRDQGKLIEARDLLAPIYGWFTEGFDTPVLQDAKTLLDELA
jgi:predicted ATPase